MPSGRGRQPAQLLLRRPAGAAGGGAAGGAPGAARRARAAGAGSASRSVLDMRALHHGRDGRPRDPDVHQQRRAGRQRAAQAAHREAGARRRARRCSPPTCCSCTACRWPSLAGVGRLAHAARLALWQPWKTLARAARLGAARGLCVDPGAPRAARARRARLVAPSLGDACPDRRRDRRPDHRHDDAHRARPHGASAARRPVRHACYVLVALPPSRALPFRWWRPSTARRRLCSAVLWSAGFGLYALRYWPVLTRARLDGKPG